MHVVVTGGTGLIGSHLVDALRSRGDEATVVSRSPEGADTIGWDPKQPGSLTLPTSTDAVVHLAGAPLIGERWTDEFKQEIRESRVLGTRTVVDAVEEHGEIGHVVSASAVGYYGDRGDEVLTEASDPANDFLARVCQEWEAEAKALEGSQAVENDPARIRSGIVLHPEEGALGQMLNPFLFVKPFHWGLGGRVGSGEQWFPWVHIEDEVGAILHILDEGVSGPVNIVAPDTVRNEEFTDALGRALKRPTVFPIPKFVLRMLYGEAATLTYASQRVLPERLKKAGYTFEHDRIQEALEDLLQDETA